MLGVFYIVLTLQIAVVVLVAFLGAGAVGDLTWQLSAGLQFLVVLGISLGLALLVAFLNWWLFFRGSELTGSVEKEG